MTISRQHNLWRSPQVDLQHSLIPLTSRDPIGCHIAANLYQLGMVLHGVDPSGNVMLVAGAAATVVVIVTVVVVGASSAACAAGIRGGLTLCLNWTSHCIDIAESMTNTFVARECPGIGFPNLLKEIDCYHRILEPNSQLCRDELNRCRDRVFSSCGLLSQAMRS